MTRPLWLIENGIILRGIDGEIRSYLIGHNADQLTVVPQRSDDTVYVSDDAYSMKLSPPMSQTEIVKYVRQGEMRDLPFFPDRYEPDLTVPHKRRLYWRSIGSFRYLESGDGSFQVVFGPCPSLKVQLEIYDKIEELPVVEQPDLLSEFLRRVLRAMKTPTPDVCSVRTCIDFNEELLIEGKQTASIH